MRGTIKSFQHTQESLLNVGPRVPSLSSLAAAVSSRFAPPMVSLFRFFMSIPVLWFLVFEFGIGTGFSRWSSRSWAWSSFLTISFGWSRVHLTRPIRQHVFLVVIFSSLNVVCLSLVPPFLGFFLQLFVLFSGQCCFL